MSNASESLRVFLVDDEFLARERIKRLLSDTNFTFCGEAENGEDAIREIHIHKPDVVLLDIRMPGIDGLKVAESISKIEPAPSIIFCTAYDEYAIDAFKYQATAYLLKPVRQEQLLTALTSATKLSQAQIKGISDSIKGETELDTFVAHTWQGLERISLDRIYYFQADHKYVTIHHEGGELVTDHSLKDIESELSSLVFRSHRNTVVMKGKVKSLIKDRDSQHFFELSNGCKVPISRRLLAPAKNLLK